MKKIITIITLSLMIVGCKKKEITPETPKEIVYHQTEVYLTSTGTRNFYINGSEMVAYQRPTTYTTKTGDVLRCVVDAYHGNVYNLDNVSVIIYIDGKEVLNKLQYSYIDINYTVE